MRIIRSKHKEKYHRRVEDEYVHKWWLRKTYFYKFSWRWEVSLETQRQALTHTNELTIRLTMCSVPSAVKSSYKPAIYHPQVVNRALVKSAPPSTSRCHVTSSKTRILHSSVSLPVTKQGTCSNQLSPQTSLLSHRQLN